MSDENYNIRKCLSLLAMHDVSCGKVRVGGPNDGGYVMANRHHNCETVYSIGVGPDASWDLEMAGYGAIVHQYDHTVNCSPANHPNLRFHQLGIGPDLANSDLITLEEMLSRNGDLGRSAMILKMDVEGAEWPVLKGLSSALMWRFSQIIIEFHSLERLREPSFRRDAEKIWSKLLETHRPIHVHGNNFSLFKLLHGVPIPDVIEVTFCHASQFDFSPSTSLFPTELDAPCNPHLPDHFLGSFRFV